MGFNTDFSTFNFDWILGGEQLLLLAFLVFLEIALSIDNFAGMRQALAGLPEASKQAIRSAASLSGLVLRIALICMFMELTLLVDPFAHQYFSIYGISTGKALFLTLGGTFLILKAITDLRAHLSADNKPARKVAQINAFAIWLQLAYIDLILSLDSVIAALSMVNSVKLIILAMVIAHLMLHLNWERIDSFFARRSSMMTLTLAFILLLGIVSLFRGLGAVLAEETLLAALMFGVLLEALNLKDKHTVVVQEETARKRSRSINARIATSGDWHSQPSSTATISGASDESIDLSGSTNPQSLDLFHEEVCSNCQTRTHQIFPFCLTCGQALATGEEASAVTAS